MIGLVLKKTCKGVFSHNNGPQRICCQWSALHEKGKRPTLSIYIDKIIYLIFKSTADCKMTTCKGFSDIPSDKPECFI